MAQLRDDLERRARETVKKQMEQPKAPRQMQAGPSKAAPRFRSQASTEVPRIPAKPEAVPKILVGKGKLSSLIDQLRPRALVPKPEIHKESFSFWELPPEATVREPAPTAISVRDRSDFENVLSSGLNNTGWESGEEIFATIGLDFGTSTTKVIVRFPYEPGIPTIAIPAPPHCRSMAHPYLWQTVLWMDGSGAFTAWPEDNATLLYSLKQGIVGHHANTAIAPNRQDGLNLTRGDAATAFLAFVVRYTRGWLFTNRAEMFRRRRPVWFINVGLPAANMDDGPLVSTYRRIVAAAMLLGSFQGPVTAETTRLFLTNRDVLAAARSSDEGEKLGISVLPETAAEVAGFAKSTNSAPGLYLMVDVGAMTLDVCAFRLVQYPSMDDLYSLFAAQVRPLGVESYHWFLGRGKTENEFVQQCDLCLRQVVWGTKKNRDPNAECWKKGSNLPVFLAGGGARNLLHRRVVETLDPWLRQYSQNEGTRILELPTPANIDLPVAVSNFGRLAVAWGLSYPQAKSVGFSHLRQSKIRSHRQ